MISVVLSLGKAIVTSVGDLHILKFLGYSMFYTVSLSRRGGFVPGNRDPRDTTVHKHEGFTPSKRQEEREKLVQATINLVNQQVGAYMREHDKDVDWATRVRAYYTHLITGQPMPGNLRIDEETRRLVRGWVDEARQTTGLKPPNRATKSKRKKRS